MADFSALFHVDLALAQDLNSHGLVLTEDEAVSIPAPGDPQVRALGELASMGGVSSVAWVIRLSIRDVLRYRWERELLRQTPKGQLASVIRALAALRQRKSR